MRPEPTVPMARRLGELPALLGSLPPLGPEEAAALSADPTRACAALREAEVQDPGE